MNVLLVRPSNIEVYDLFKLKTRERVEPPFGLMYLAAWLRKARPDDKVEIWDAECKKLDYKKMKQFDVVGAGGTTPEYDLIEGIFKKVKEIDNDIVTVAGGPHFTAAPNPTPNIDYIVTGEAEASFAELVGRVEKGEKRPKKTEVIKGKTVENLDEIPFPARDMVDNDCYTYMIEGKLQKATLMMTSRGCPYKCIFCHNSKIPRKLRFRSLDNVVEEMRDLAKYKLKNFLFVDDTFTLNRKRVMELCDRMIKEDFDFRWACFTRADTITSDMVKKMEDAGCRELSIGVETGNKEILEIICKGETKEQIVKASEIVSKFPKIDKRSSYIIGHPYETRETAMETINFAKSLPVDRAFFNIMTPYPSSVIYDMAKAGKGIRILTENWSEYKRFGNCVIETDELSRDDIIELQKTALKEFWTQPRVVMTHLERLVEKDAKKKRYAKPVMDELRKLDKIPPAKVKGILEVLNRLIGKDENKRFYNRPLIEALCLLGNIPIEEFGQ